MLFGWGQKWVSFLMKIVRRLCHKSFTSCLRMGAWGHISGGSVIGALCFRCCSLSCCHSCPRGVLGLCSHLVPFLKWHKDALTLSAPHRMTLSILYPSVEEAQMYIRPKSMFWSLYEFRIRFEGAFNWRSSQAASSAVFGDMPLGLAEVSKC